MGGGGGGVVYAIHAANGIQNRDLNKGNIHRKEKNISKLSV